MKHFLHQTLILAAAGMAAGFAPAMAQPAQESARDTVRLMEYVKFYDGYNSTIFDADKDDGILRLSNWLYSMPIPEDLLDRAGDDVTLDIWLGALCDNYDRIGSVNIAFLPKGTTTYTFDEAKRIEIARYITPFMNKNKRPKDIPYSYDLPGLGLIFRDKELREKYDLWMETDLFGVPYAANKQVAGCSGRNDVFDLTVDFSFTPATAEMKEEQRNVIVPVYVKIAELHGNKNLNNYNPAATDTLGVTTRTWKFNVPEDVTDSKIVLINSNHGAAENGEEYVRRLHLVYVDSELQLAYTPGGESCEPYRKYNTQTNGIYGYSPKTDWSWNNWCPGAAVPIREIPLGAMKAGEHSVMIRIPDAVFYNKDGDARPSIYFQGVKSGVMPADVTAPSVQDRNKAVWNRQGNILTLSAETEVESISLYTLDGTLLYGTHRNAPLSLERLGGQPGIAVARMADGSTSFFKVM